MKRHKRPNLPKMPSKGDPISVDYYGTLVQATVRSGRGGKLIHYSASVPNISGGRTRVKGSEPRSQEGVSWARGHGTPEANMLGTALALMDDRHVFKPALKYLSRHYKTEVQFKSEWTPTTATDEQVSPTE